MQRAPNSSIINTAAATTAALTLLAVTAAAGAQILPPVPERTPPSAPYEPPPPPPPPKPVEQQPQPEAPKPLPSIVQRDAEGKVIPIETTKARAALLAFDYTEEERVKVEAALDAYQAEVDQAVIDNAGSVLQIRTKAQNIEEVAGIDQMAAMADVLRELPQLDLLKTAQRTGAITAVQRRRVDNVMKEYDDAVHKDLAATYEKSGDVQALMNIKLRQSFLERTYDLRASLERQVNDLAPRLKDLTAKLDLSSDQRKQVDTILKTRIAPHAQAWKIFEEVLNDEQRSAILKAAAGAVDTN